MPDLLDLSRKATKARLLSLARNSHRMTPDELQLMDRLLDEYARQSKAWRREVREAGHTTNV